MYPFFCSKNQFKNKLPKKGFDKRRPEIANPKPVLGQTTPVKDIYEGCIDTN